MQVIEQATGLGEGLGQVVPIAAGGRRVEHMPVGNQFSGQIDKLIEQIGSHSDGAYTLIAVAAFLLATIIEETDLDDTTDLQQGFFDMAFG